MEKSIKFFQKIIYYLKNNNIDYGVIHNNDLMSFRFNNYVFCLINKIVYMPGFLIINPDAPPNHKIWILKRMRCLYEQNFKTFK